MDVDSLDVQDSICLQSYKAGTTLRVSTPSESLPKTNYSLFSVSNLFGWATFAVNSSQANSTSRSSFVLTRVDDLQAALDQAKSYSVHPFPADQFQALEIPTISFCSNSFVFITHITFASWDRLIIVATSDGSLHIFSLYALANQTTKAPIKSIPSANSVPLKMLVPNPSQGGPLSGVIAAVYQNGTIKIFDSYQIDKTYWTAEFATVAEWSPMGKRLMVGYTDGRLEFVTHEGVIKGKIDPPALVKDEGLAVLHIKWLDQKNYLITFIQPIDGPDALSETFCLHVPRQADPSACTFSRVTDAITSDGTSSLLPDLLTLTLPVNPQTNWKHLTISSFTLSTTLTLIGYNTSDQPFILNLGEAARPEIPASEEDYSPTSTLGLGASYCAREKMPLIWCLTTDGVLALWKVQLVNPTSEPNSPEVWNEIVGYSDILATEEKGVEGPPMAAAVVTSSVNTASTAQPQAGLVSVPSSFGALGTPSAPIASSHVTAFGKPSLGVSSSTAFGNSSALNQSGSSSIAFGKSSLGPSASPFASLLSGSTPVGFSSFANPSSVNQVPGNPTISASASGGFAAFSSSSGNTGSNVGFAAFSNSSDKQASGFASFSNSTDNPTSGFASFANSSDKTGLASSSVFDQFTAAASQSSFLDGSMTTKTTSIFDNPTTDKESLKPETVDNSNKLAFGVTKPRDSSLLIPKLLSQPDVSFKSLQNSSTFQSRATAEDEDNQRQVDTRSIASGPSTPPSTHDSTKNAQPAKQPPPSFDISSLGLSTNLDTPGHLSSANQKPGAVADDKSNQSYVQDKSAVSSPTSPSSTQNKIERAQSTKLPSLGFDMSSLGLSINSNTPGDLASDDEDNQSSSDHTSSLSAPNSMEESKPSKASSPSRDVPTARPPLSVHGPNKSASTPNSMSSISFGFGGRTLPNPMRPSPLGSGAVFLPKLPVKDSIINALPPEFVAPPQVSVSCDVLPSKPLASSISSPEGTASQATGATQPGSLAEAEPEPKSLIGVHSKPRAADIVPDLHNESSITSPSPDKCVTVPQAPLVGNADVQVDCADSEHLDESDINSQNKVDVSSENDNDLSENVDDELLPSDDDESSESEDTNNTGSQDVSDNGDEHELGSVKSVASVDANSKGKDIPKHKPHDQLETSLSNDSQVSQLQCQEEEVHRPNNHASGTQSPLDDKSVASTSPKSLFGLTSSPPSKIRRSLTSNRETSSHPAVPNPRSTASAHESSLGLPPETTTTSPSPVSQSSRASSKTSPVHQTAPYTSQSTPALQEVVSSTKAPSSNTSTTCSLPPPFLVAQPEFTPPITFLSSETVPKIYVNTSSESFSKPDEGLDQALSKVIDLITSEIECLASVSSVCRQHLSECCKKLPPNSAVAMREVPSNLLFGDLPAVFHHVQSLTELAKQKQKENTARLQAATALDNALIKADMKVEEIKRILRLRNDPGFSQVIRTRQLGPVQLAHQKDMRRMIRDVKHGISQMAEVLQSFESQHREASTRKNRIQTPSLDTINRCIRFITLGLTQHIINLEKLHLQVSQHKARTCSLKGKKESLGVNSLSSGSSSHTPDQTEALRALMSEHRGAILKESILKRGDEPILTQAQTMFPTNSSGEPSGLSHIRSHGIIIISPKQKV